MAQTEDLGRRGLSRPPRETAWVVSPHRLVAQAVAAALEAAGAPVAFREWDTLRRDLRTRSSTDGTRHVVTIVDGLVDDAEMVVDGVGELTAAGDVRVVVITTDAAPPRWNRLLADERIEVVTMTTSIRDLAATITQFTAGWPLMTPDERVRLRSEWELLRTKQLAARQLIEALSPRQLLVLRLLATGRRVHEVARILDVADGTVRSHVRALRQRIGARSQLEAVAVLRQAEDAGGPEPPPGGSVVPRPRASTADDWHQAPRR